MEEGRIVIDVETQTYRFTPSAPINHQEAVSLAGETRYPRRVNAPAAVATMAYGGSMTLTPR